MTGRETTTVEVDREALLHVLDMAAVALHDPCRHTVEQRGKDHGYDCDGTGEAVALLRAALCGPEATRSPERSGREATRSTSGGSMTTTTEYAVLCPRDGKVRDISTPDPAKAAEWAASRDVECGKCYVGQGKHVVVSRTLTPWTPDA